MILLIDNYDSFTYNLFQYISEHQPVVVVRNDKITLHEIEEMNPDAIVISPGPGLPENAGICLDIIQEFHRKIPILGVCLGHQAIAVALGGKVKQAKEIKHGKTSLISHNEKNMFEHLSSPETFMRYHSLVVDKETLPKVLKVEAVSMDDDEIMAITHEAYPTYGVQFHPESIGSPAGKQMIENFLKRIGKESIENEAVS